MLIFSIDTSCDETAAAVTDGVKVLSNIVWSQASLHARWGGVVPSLAQREHQERIGWVVEAAMRKTKHVIRDVDAIAVTIGPGLAIALGVGIDKAKELAKKYNKSLIPVNHIEGHILSALAESNSKGKRQKAKIIKFPALGLAVSGGTTQIVLIEKIGSYRILADKVDDALGEALDKGARMLGLGYPGGANLEKMAYEGNTKSYPLPIPMLGQENRLQFSYSGLKTAMWRLINSLRLPAGEAGLGTSLSKKQICDLAATFQDNAFEHLIRVLRVCMEQNPDIDDLFIGGGVGANAELRKRVRKLCRGFNLTPHFPYSKKLYGDNAAMIGVAASFKFNRGEMVTGNGVDLIDRVPRAKIDSPFTQEPHL